MRSGRNGAGAVHWRGALNVISVSLLVVAGSAVSAGLGTTDVSVGTPVAAVRVPELQQPSTVAWGLQVPTLFLDVVASPKQVALGTSDEAPEPAAFTVSVCSSAWSARGSCPGEQRELTPPSALSAVPLPADAGPVAHVRLTRIPGAAPPSTVVVAVTAP